MISLRCYSNILLYSSRGLVTHMFDSESIKGVVVSISTELSAYLILWNLICKNIEHETIDPIAARSITPSENVLTRTALLIRCSGSDVLFLAKVVAVRIFTAANSLSTGCLASDINRVFFFIVGAVVLRCLALFLFIQRYP